MGVRTRKEEALVARVAPLHDIWRIARVAMNLEDHAVAIDLSIPMPSDDDSIAYVCLHARLLLKLVRCVHDGGGAEQALEPLVPERKSRHLRALSPMAGGLVGGSRYEAAHAGTVTCSSASRTQKLASLTFQDPDCRTDRPS